MPKTVNYQVAKVHRNYTAEEAARMFGVHRNTVRQWIRRYLTFFIGIRLGRQRGQDSISSTKARSFSNGAVTTSYNP